MMYEGFYEFLIRYKKLPVPGIGTFFLHRETAINDIIHHEVKSPRYSFNFQRNNPEISAGFLSRLAAMLNLDTNTAKEQLNQFANSILDSIEKGNKIEWNGVGLVEKDEQNNIHFQPAGKIQYNTVPAKRVLRQDAEHAIRVGEDQRSSTEMVKILNRPIEKRSIWWAAALAVGLLAVVFIGWYFSEHGVDVQSTANTIKLKPADNPGTYQLIP
jgi:nucleoid DNA-binding protein